jgi:hypothetical protein
MRVALCTLMYALALLPGHNGFMIDPFSSYYISGSKRDTGLMRKVSLDELLRGGKGEEDAVGGW